MFAIIVGIVVCAFFIGVMGIAFTLKRNRKSNISCSGGCSACKH